MKRGQPLRRTPIQRGGRVRPRREEPRRAGERAEHGMPYPDAREAVWHRSRGRCEACGGSLAAAMEAHHRLTRRYGPDCPCNLLALCGRCHHTDVHGSPAAARERGQIVSRHSAASPGTVPVLVHGRGWVYLTCDGRYFAGSA